MIVVFLVAVLFSLSGIILHNYFYTNSAVVDNQNTQRPTSPTLVNYYASPQFKYTLQYPAYFTLDETKPEAIALINETCAQNASLCFLGVDSVHIQISSTTSAVTLTQQYDTQKKSNETCKLIKILPLPENLDVSQSIEAIRCEHPEVPKQAKGGYSYTIVRANLVYTIEIIQSDSTLSAFLPDGALTTLTHDTYDPTGDMMMRTFTFSDPR